MSLRELQRSWPTVLQYALRSEQVTGYLELLPDPLSEICSILSELILSCGEDVIEAWNYSRPVYLIDSHECCYITVNKADVNLGFDQGALLNDPGGLLIGTGIRHRHVKFLDPEGIDREAVSALIRQALNHYR